MTIPTYYSANHYVNWFNNRLGISLIGIKQVSGSIYFVIYFVEKTTIKI
jgi:hypothetical protein